MQRGITRYALRIVLFISGLLLFVNSGIAQCAMCKAVADDAANHSAYGIWSGLNMGIIFLMAFPYVLISIVVLVFFRKQMKGFVKSFNAIHR